ncbi:MAG: amylo-alpha-1,6-glucosidase, partial [Verrucomicrobiales bacterium]|nr:amylo-alpha-1,6-glucosidase [Verrucomicrobiales bacterium]
MEKLIRRIDLTQARGDNARQLLRREWLLTNGLGGYASSTISGIVTWRYHGLLIAALPAPLGRMVMFNHLSEYLRFDDGRLIQIGGEEPSQPDETGQAGHFVTEFRLENQIPIWRYEIGQIIIEKRILLIHGQNTVHVTYSLRSNQESIRLELRPSMHFRAHEHPVGAPLEEEYVVSMSGDRYEIAASESAPKLRLSIRGDSGSFIHEGGSKREIFYQKEADRGYESRGLLWSPGHFRVNVLAKRDATLIGSTEPWSTILALSPDEAFIADTERRRRLLALASPKARSGPAAELVLAADQFIITPAGRVEDTARAHAAGDEIRTVIAGYHWFTDCGRDTMISLEGLTLCTGREAEAGWILRTFAHYIRHGLIPNLFPEGRNEGLYHTADATLWFFQALARYLDTTGDRATLKLILPKLIDVIDRHMSGTKFGIGLDSKDGLLRQGQAGYQLTWMDAKVEDWVVTPRRGKAVEINALWYNALRLLEGWLREEQQENVAQRIAEQAEQTRQSFNARFWYEQGGYLYDVIDGENGDDNACRPNQVLAISLLHPVLNQPRWKPVLEVARERLLTPVGLRSLSRDHPDYKAKYFGDLRARDAAYHQGTVWAWLIGPFIDAWLKVYPEDRAGA